jgi:predicted transposase/invertase (TIGR01784 family)
MFLHDSRNAVLKAKEEGLKQGIEIGERKAKLALAQQLLDCMDVETISQLTRLSIAEIQALKKAAP